MFRFVDNLRILSAISWTACLMDGIAVIVFGAPPVARLFYVGCALMAFTSFANRMNRHEKRRKR